MRVWITKYALTKGVIVAEAEDPGIKENTTNMIVVRGGDSSYDTYYHGNDWRKTRSEAIAQVKKMIAAKRRSIEKQKAKLDKFEKELERSVPE